MAIWIWFCRFTSANSLASVMPQIHRAWGMSAKASGEPSLFYFISDYPQRRVKQVQCLLIDHTFVLFSYNRSIPRASKHFCRARAPVQMHSYPPCERRELLHTCTTCWVHDGLIVWFKPQGSGGVSEINKRLWNVWNISQVMSCTLSKKH